MNMLYDANFFIKLIFFMIAAAAIVYFVVNSFCGSLPPEPDIAGFIHDEPETLLDKIKKII